MTLDMKCKTWQILNYVPTLAHCTLSTFCELIRNLRNSSLSSTVVFMVIKALMHRKHFIHWIQWKECSIINSTIIEVNWNHQNILQLFYDHHKVLYDRKLTSSSGFYTEMWIKQKKQGVNWKQKYNDDMFYLIDLWHFKIYKSTFL